MSGLRSLLFGVAAAVAMVTAAPAPARATEPAQDEALAYAIGVQTYIAHFPLMDLYRTLWETSFDPERGHDRTLNEFFVFERLITSEDDWGISPNNGTIDLPGFFDLRAEPIVLVIPPIGDRQYWVPISDMWHDFDARLSWDTVGSQGGAFALVAPDWQGVLPEGVRLDRRMSGEPMVAASGAMLGLLWNPAEISTYDVAFLDRDGTQLDGRNRYVIRFDPPSPVDAVWSLTMDSAANQLFVPKIIDRYSIGDRTPDDVDGEDGSIEIFLQAEEPTDPTERASWLPAPEGPFYLLTRHYSPKAAILTGDWLPSPVKLR